MIMTDNLFDKYRSISFERVNDFLTKRSIEHQCTELRKIEFKFEGFTWFLSIEDDFFNIHLGFNISEEIRINNNVIENVAENACLEVTKRMKVIKAHYSSHEFYDEDNGNKIVKCNVLHFCFESYCYNMNDFGKLFFTGLDVILGGYSEYHKLYAEIKSKLPSAPIGFRSMDSNDSHEKSQPTNNHRIGFH